MIEQKKPQWKHATLETYNKTWNVVFSKYFGPLQPEELTTAKIPEFKNWYLKNFPTREPSKIKIHLQVWVDYLLVNRVITSPPDLDGLKDLVKICLRNSKRQKVGRALSIEETEQLIEAATFYGTEWAAACVLISISCGMRKEEIQDRGSFRYDHKLKKLEIFSQKNSKWREVPFKSIIETYYGEKILNFLSASSATPRFSSQALDYHWNKIKRAAGIQGRLRFHDLRHTFASRTAEWGWSPTTACDILDMSLGVYQRIYAKPSFASKEELFNR